MGWCSSDKASAVQAPMFEHIFAHIHVFPALVGAYTAWQAILSHTFHKTLFHCSCVVVIAGMQINDQAREPVDSSVDREFPSRELHVTIDVPEGIRTRYVVSV